jgi:membrane associated rhomboid family serine protease
VNQPVEVFRSHLRRPSDERAFVLTAVGINSWVEWDGSAWVLSVESVARAHAEHHLWQYEQERQRPVPKDVPFHPQPGAWHGSLLYVAALLLVPFALAQGWFPVDPYVAGVMDPLRMQAGEWWRAVTALTLHWDASHLLGNVGSGALLGFSAAQVWGNARAWLLILLAGVLANFTEGMLGQGGYVSAGASTAVFAALGLVAAHAWRTRRQSAQSSMRRWAPLIAGVAMLGFFGSGAGSGTGSPGLLAEADTTNVLSHALGFVAGVLCGVLAASHRGAAWLMRVPAWLAGIAVPVLVLGAWTLAQWPTV